MNATKRLRDALSILVLTICLGLVVTVQAGLAYTYVTTGGGSDSATDAGDTRNTALGMNAKATSESSTASAHSAPPRGQQARPQVRGPHRRGAIPWP